MKYKMKYKVSFKMTLKIFRFYKIIITRIKIFLYNQPFSKLVKSKKRYEQGNMLQLECQQYFGNTLCL